MSEPKEITIRIKCEDELVIKKSFHLYDDMHVSSDDEIIQARIKETKGNYDGAIEEILITIKLVI